MKFIGVMLFVPAWRRVAAGVAFFLTAAGAVAAPVDEATALRVANNYVTQHVAVNGDWAGSASPRVAGVELVAHAGRAVVYVATVKPSGYLLVSYDDDIVPVVLYSPVGKFDLANFVQLGSVESWILPETGERLAQVAQRRSELLQTVDENAIAALREEYPAAGAWRFYNRDPADFVPLQVGFNEKVAALDGATVKVEKLGPLLRTTWNQGEDRAPFTYNLYTPAGSGCTHTVTGCVATAASQILKYWNWPDIGTGSFSYSGGSANFARAYAWSSMPNALSASSSSIQIDAVARLMSDVGIAFRMSYGCGATGGSGAVTDDVATIFPSYFKYKNTIRTLTRSALSATAFFNGIKAELDASPPRPVLFSMRTSSGGHAVVVDGYNQGVTNTVQINMGWGGYANAFYDISNDWSAGGLSWIASTQRAFVGIEPTSSVSTCTYSLNSSGTSVSLNGGGGSVTLTTGGSCAWTMSASASWISVTPLSGAGSTSFSYTVQANTTSGSRSGFLSVGGQIFSITQAAGAGSCSYSLTSASQSFSSGSGSASFTLNTGSTCSWSVTPDASWNGASAWITFLSPTSGTGSSTITYSVAPNAASGSRSASLLVAGQSHVVTQSGSCGYAIYPSTQSVAASGASSNFRLETGGTCTWTAASGVNWLSVGAPTAGTASATISYTASANGTGASRTGTITVGRQVFTVTQSAAGVTSASIANGDFEQGATVWSQAGSQLLYNDPARSHGGYWLAWLGGYNSGTDTLSQVFTVPSNASSVGLRFWYNITTSDGTSSRYDLMTVDVHNAATGAKLATLGSLSNVDATSGWVQSSSLSLTPYRGQSIRLVFNAVTDSSNPTSFYIDDVTLTSIGATCSYSVTPVSQAVGSTISTVSFDVVTTPAAGCNWTATTSDPWLAISGGTSGTGTGTARVSASENTTGSARAGSALIAGQTVSISQAAALVDSAIVKNGEFESGSDYWQEGSTAGYGVVASDPSVTARTGVGYAWMMGYNAGTDTLSQTVNIPSNIVGAQFNYWYRIVTQETLSSAYDSMTVSIVDAVTNQVLATGATLSNLNKTSTWTRSADLDLSTFKGRVVKILFTATADGSNVTSFFIDSIAITTSGSTPGVASKLLKTGGIDVDGDGRGDIVVRSPTGGMMTGRLVGNQILFTPIADPGPNYKVMAALDMDSQGKSDLLLLNMAQGDSGEARVWGSFNPSLPKSLRNVRTLWRVDAVGDLDGDGKGDFVWRFTGNSGNIDDTGVSYIWFTNGSGVTQVRKRGGAPLNWNLVGAMDINGDGAADMIYVSPSNQIRVLMATPNRTCANLSGGSFALQFSAMTLGSFTGVNKREIMMRDSNGTVQFLSLDATGTPLPVYTGSADDPNASCTPSTQVVPTTLSRLLQASDPSLQLIATTDLNGDGLTDFVWRNQANGALVLWIMGPGGQLSSANINAGTLSLDFVPIQR